jgi:uracil-DNA glycosylase
VIREPLNSINDVLEIGVYITTTVKSGKTGTSISTDTIKECPFSLEEKLKLSQIRVYMLMGDVLIKSFNNISKRSQIISP